MSAHVELAVVTESPSAASTPLLVVPVFQGELSALRALGEPFEVLSEAAAGEGFQGRRGQTLALPTFGRVGATRLGLVGLGKRAEWSATRMRGTLCAAAGLATGRRLDRFTLLIEPLRAETPNLERWLAEGVAYASYRFDRYRSEREEDEGVTLVRVEVLNEGQALDEAGLNLGRVVGQAVCFARDLVNEPPNTCTPSYLAQIARDLAARYSLEAEVLVGVEALEAAGLTMVAAVGRGSQEPPSFMHLTYRGKAPTRRVALVGKGVTFDSGGYSLKPPPSQVGMQGDMAGGAAVLAAARILGELRPAGVEVHCLVPSAENLVSGHAYRVNDVLTGHNGKTVEITNTDAEGRLLLADALSYAESLGVDEMVDIATLTGANVIALGGLYAGVFSEDEALAARFLNFADTNGELFWRMPYEKRLAKMLKSNIADVKNSGGRNGSSITGALFLGNFVKSTPWLHVDMAGLEQSDESWEHVGKGGTGFGAATLAEFAAGGWR